MVNQMCVKLGIFLQLFPFGIKAVLSERLGLFISNVDNIDCVMCRPREKPFAPLWTKIEGIN
jgi:hypothetical protein